MTRPVSVSAAANADHRSSSSMTAFSATYARAWIRMYKSPFERNFDHGGCQRDTLAKISNHDHALFLNLVDRPRDNCLDPLYPAALAKLAVEDDVMGLIRQGHDGERLERLFTKNRLRRIVFQAF
jgi:hypothetical protein